MARKYRIIEFRVGAVPVVLDVASPWDHTKGLIGEDSMIQAVRLGDGTWLLMDEEGGIKGLPFNRAVSALARKIDTSVYDRVFYASPGLARPGDAGVYMVLGNFVITRHVSGKGKGPGVTDADIEKYTSAPQTPAEIGA